MKQLDPCGCFPSGRHYPGIAHLLKTRIAGVAEELSADAPWTECAVAFLDVETTGLRAASDRIIELAIVRGERGQVVRRTSWLVNPGVSIPEESSKIHGIRNEDVAGAPTFAEVAGLISEELSLAIPAAYNALFDREFVMAEMDRAGFSENHRPPALRRDVDWIDPLVLARELHREEKGHRLEEMASRLGIPLARAHRATDDAEAGLLVLYALGKDARVPRTYGALVREQRRLTREQLDARRAWRRN